MPRDPCAVQQDVCGDASFPDAFKGVGDRAVASQVAIKFVKPPPQPQDLISQVFGAWVVGDLNRHNICSGFRQSQRQDKADATGCSSHHGRLSSDAEQLSNGNSLWNRHVCAEGLDLGLTDPEYLWCGRE